MKDSIQKSVNNSEHSNYYSKMVAGKEISDVDLRRLSMHSDLRGCFTEVFQESWGSFLKPKQFSVVSSNAGVMRGCHFHNNHDEYFCLISGEASIGLRDERPDSATLGCWSLYRMHARDLVALIFPRGVVHGWYFHEASIHLQAVSEPYSQYAAYDNHRVDWRDPDLEIPWPAQTAMISPEAASAISLRELQTKILMEPEKR